ncbi:B-cell antigen receptor complex-associated protein beta chain isoform X1 [Sus scrofa]|uniref:B-cell antigen receptor complex-associated protein beta chain isoform X1 n=1 Tax=Sus scrofa TaxID=9823 RepID=UPI000A2B2E5E|nr:B-cell antigen receptor complex-associated protein beta chain isoform X1 [Sus scrofa]
MAGPALSPGLSNWLVLLLLLLSGETVLEAETKELRDPKGGACSRIWQHPRFVARKRGSMVEIRCYVEDPGIVSWLRKQEADLEPKIFPPEEGRIIQNQTTSEATLIIQGVQFQDNGVYYCKQECSKEPLRTEQGCGTELRVMGFSTLAQLKRRNTLKDGIIMIQTLLIILFIIVPIFLLLDKVTGTGGPGSSRRAGQTCAGSPFPQSLPADSPRQLLLRASALLAECTSPLTSHLLPLTSHRGQSPGASAAWPSGGGGGDTNALLSILTRQDDSKPGMEEDHTYEGLDIDQTATYEDIVTLRTGEVKWSVGEHPGQE